MGAPIIPKNGRKVKLMLTTSFKRFWTLKMPWVKPILNEVGLIGNVKFCVCTHIERKETVFVIK